MNLQVLPGELLRRYMPSSLSSGRRVTGRPPALWDRAFLLRIVLTCVDLVFVGTVPQGGELHGSRDVFVRVL